ncbi:RING-H2 finger protein ATL79-like [Corylus avellana]|uniref:RING-H2 finger protein ATL79-like n=1 Tax=Corylus avellana TaxID=13451 RepID=UPI00286BFC8A|nr:RING-H2 finger protein ATL79-like [Corylus avellana]
MPLSTPTQSLSLSLSLSLSEHKYLTSKTKSHKHSPFLQLAVRLERQNQMRPLLEPATVAPHEIHLSPPLAAPTTTSRCEPHGCKWQPYSNSGDFEANAAVIFIVLLCALICALALNAAIRCFLRGGHHPPVPDTLHQNHQQQQQQQQIHNQQKSNLEKDAADDPLAAAPTLVFSAGMKLAGAEAECAICLSEFMEGEGIRVLGRCKHGFHAQCIEMWFSSHSSCPTCRGSCLPASPSAQQASEHCQSNSIQQSLPIASGTLV